MLDQNNYQEEYSLILTATLDLIQKYYGQQSYDQESDQIRERFGRLSSEAKAGLCAQIDELIEDITQRILILSAIFSATKDEICLESIEELLLSDAIDYDVARTIDFQVLTQRFVNGFRVDYARQRGILKHLKDRLAGFLEPSILFLPTDHRNPNRIIVVTDQFILSGAHAPSKMVRELCHVLKDELGYEIVLFVPAELRDVSTKNYNIWIEGFVSNYSDLWGDNEVRFEDGTSVRVIQMAVDSQNIDGLSFFIDFVNDFNPMYIWHVGEQLCTTEILNEITSVAAIPCNAGVAVSEAPLLFRYLNNEEDSDVYEWVEKTGQEIFDIRWGSLTDNVESYSHSELGFEEECFLISVMGNRLDSEIDQDFISIMKEIVDRDPVVRFILIGECSISFAEQGLSEYIRCLGFRKDYQSILKSCDLVINPRRRGAGSCGDAVYYLTPVITLGDCDVASVVENDAFICGSYADYPELVHRYINDADFCKAQLDECMKSRNRKMGYSLKDEVRAADEHIRSKIIKQTQEISIDNQIPNMKNILTDAMLVESLYEMINYARLAQLDLMLDHWNEASNRIQKLIPEVAAKDIEAGRRLLECWKHAREERQDHRRLAYIVEYELLPEIKETLGKLNDVTDISDEDRIFERTPSGFYTVRDLSDGRYLHSADNPMWEASVLADRLYDPVMDSFHILGCGLGYLAYQIWEKSEQTAHIYIYEDDAKMIDHAWKIGALSLIDPDHLTLIPADDTGGMLNDFLINAERNLHNFYISDWKLRVYSSNRYGAMIDSLDFNERTRQLYERSWQINTRENNKLSIRGIEDLNDIKDLSERDFVVVSAGPSLDDSIQFLRECKGNKTIIAINAVLKRLASEQIKPDLIVMLDPKQVLRSHLDGVEDFTDDIPLVFPINASHGFAGSYRGPKYAFSDYERTPDGFEWNFGGTVASLGLDLAYYLHATKVYLIGSDLAFSENKNYADGLVHDSNEGIQGSLLVESTDGSKVATYQLYNVYRKTLENQIALHPDVPVINMAKHGAKIEGTITYKSPQVIVKDETGIFEEILSDINEFAKRYFAQEEYEEYTDLIRSKYSGLSADEQDRLYEWVEGLFADDIQLRIMIISAIYHATRNPECLTRIESLLTSDGLPYDIISGLWRCTAHERFRRGFLQMGYFDELNLINILKDRLQAMIDVPAVNVIPNERNSNRVVIITEQILPDSHAPSHMVYTLCDVLQNKLGYEVLLAVAAERSNSVAACADVFFDIYMTNYNDNLWGLHDVTYRDDLTIRTLQFHVSADTLNEVRQAYDYIREFNPMYVWNVGDPHIFAELFRGITTLVSLPINAGLPVSNAPILVRYMRHPEQEIEESALSRGQKVLDMSWHTPLGDIKATDRKTLGISEDRFLIAVMGNRLDTEIDDDFINIMRKSISMNPCITYVIIGNCTIDFSLSGIEDNVQILGYRAEYLSDLKMCDICVNPRRRGGGGASAAVRLGTPVITLDDCDVAGAIDDNAFVCDRYEDFPELIDRYVNDDEYMNQQSERCKMIHEYRESFDITDELKRVDGEIRQVINNETDK